MLSIKAYIMNQTTDSSVNIGFPTEADGRKDEGIAATTPGNDIQEMPETDNPEVENTDINEMPEIEESGVEDTDIPESPDTDINEMPEQPDGNEVNIPPAKT